MKTIKEACDRFAADIESLVREKVRGELLEKLASGFGRAADQAREELDAAAPRVQKVRASARRKKGQKRDPQVLEALMNELHLGINLTPGRNIEQIGKALKRPTSELSLPIAKLIASGKISRRGQRRATRYYPGLGKKKKTQKKTR